MDNISPNKSIDHILITGATGALGQQVLKKLQGTNQQITILSTKDDTGLHNVNIIKADITNIESIRDAVSRATIIIHCASNPPNAKLVDLEGSRNLLAAVDKNKLKHFIYVSIAGVDKSEFPYYVIKHQVEQMVKAAGLPFTILRATQFHDFVLYRMIKPFDISTGLVIPAGLKFQSIDITEVAQKIQELVINDPINNVLTIGGPAILTIEDMTKAYLETLGRPPHLLNTAMMDGDRFDMLRSGINLCKDDSFGKITWQQYLTSLVSDDKL